MLVCLATPSPVRSQVGSADTDFLYARKLYDDRLYALAAQEFSRFVKNYAGDHRVPDARFYAGLSYFAVREYDQARRDFQYLAIDFPKDPRAPEAWLKVAECYAALGDYTAAANALSSIAVFYPEAPNAVASVLLASDYFVKAGDLRSAKDRLLKLIADRPDIPEVPQTRLKLAALYRQEHNFQQAGAELQLVIDRGKDPELVATALFEKARLCDQSGRSDDARSLYARIVNRYGKTRTAPMASFELAVFLMQERSFDEARKSFEGLAEAQAAPKSVRDAARMNLGDIAFVLGQYVQAADIYKSLAGSRTDSSTHLVEAHLKWGLALENSNLIGAANDRYSFVIDSVEERPADSVYVRLALLRLAQNHARKKNYPQAARTYDRFVKRFAAWPKVDRIYYNLGRILTEGLNDHTEAVRILEKLLQVFPGSAYADEAALHLAKALVRSGRTIEATDLLRQFGVDYPGSEVAGEAEAEREYIDRYFEDRYRSTLENLILLLGGLIDEKPRDEIGLAYARLFFDQLKDYRSAATLFRKVAVTSQNNKLSTEATYFQAQSFERLWLKGPDGAVYADSAAMLYRRLTGGAYGDEAAMALVRILTAQTSDEKTRSEMARTQYTAMLTAYPASRYRDRMLLELGKALFTLGNIRPAMAPVSGKSAAGKKGAEIDSVAPIDRWAALDCFGEVSARHAKGACADDADFYTVLSWARLGVMDQLAGALNRYLTLHPRGTHVARAHYLLARLREDNGEFAQANALYDELRQKYFYSPYADSAYLGLGNTYLLTKQYQKAIDTYLQSRKRSDYDLDELDLFAFLAPPHNPVDYRIAYCYDRLNNLSRAVQYYEAYLYPDRKGPHAIEALQAMGRLFEERGQPGQAIRHYGYLATLYPETKPGFDALVKMAEIRFEAEQYKEARELFAKLGSLATDATQRMIFDSRVIVCAYRLGQVNTTAELEKAFSRKYAKEKGQRILFENYNAEFRYELGRYYQYTGKNYELAYKTYARVVDEFKSASVIPEVLYEMGVIRYRQGRSKDGMALLQDIPQKFPDSEILPQVYLRIAIEAFQLEQVQTAIETGKMALSHPGIRPTDARYAMDFLIKVYKAAGLYENALVLIQQYLEKFPDDDPANIFSKRIDIGVMHKNLKSYNRAIEYLKDLQRTASGEDEAEIQYNIADTYFAMGNFEQALLEYLRIPYLTMGAKFDWASAAKSQAAECYVKLKKYQEAVGLYEEILKKNGANSEYGLFAKQRIEEIRRLDK